MTTSQGFTKTSIIISVLVVILLAGGAAVLFTDWTVGGDTACLATSECTLVETGSTAGCWSTVPLKIGKVDISYVLPSGTTCACVAAQCVTQQPDGTGVQENVNTDTNVNDAILGGDRDEHGCIPSAGYTWCEAKQKCLREWEENCSETENANASTVDSRQYASEDGYSFTTPDGWYLHDQVWLPTEESPELSGATEGYAFGPQFTIHKTTFSDYRSDVTTQAEFIDTIDDGPDGTLEEGWVTRNGLSMYRAVIPAGEASGNVETYYYFDGDTVYIISHYPYDPATQYSQDFESMVNSFTITS